MQTAPKSEYRNKNVLLVMVHVAKKLLQTPATADIIHSKVRILCGSLAVSDSFTMAYGGVYSPDLQPT